MKVGVYKINERNRVKLIGLANKGKRYKCNRKGHLNKNAKLTVDDVLNIRKLFQDGISGPAIAKKYGCSDVQVYNIVNRKQWTNV